MTTITHFYKIYFFLEKKKYGNLMRIESPQKQNTRLPDDKDMVEKLHFMTRSVSTDKRYEKKSN